MPTPEQLIYVLSSNPSDENIKLAIDSIKLKKSSSKSAMTLVETLMDIPRAAPHLSALSTWMKTARWRNLAFKRLCSLEHLDWILTLLKENPKHRDAGALWDGLLSSYTNREIVHGASDWLLRYGADDTYASAVAARLLRESSTHDLIKLSRELLERNPDDFMLARALINRATDDYAIDCGIQILIAQDPVIGGMVAPALATSGERGAEAVRDFLKKNRKSKNYIRIIDGFTYEAPELAAVLLAEWMSTHPKSKDGQRMLTDLLCHLPSQELTDLLWTWSKATNPKSDILDVVAIFSTGFPAPADAVEYAESWLEANEKHSLWIAVLMKVVEQNQVEKQVAILNRWHHRLSARQKASMTAVIVKVVVRANMDGSSIAVALCPELQEIFKQQIETAELLEEPMSEFSLVNQIARKEPLSIQTGKNWLVERRLEWRWSSLHEYRGEIIAALLVSAPDDFVCEEARRWLDKGSEPLFESLYKKVDALYRQ